jgi:hypothetical protein
MLFFGGQFGKRLVIKPDKVLGLSSVACFRKDS